MDYPTLTEADKLILARDVLRGRESDHYRTAVLSSSPGAPARLEQLEQEIIEARDEVELRERTAEEERNRLVSEAKERERAAEEERNRLVSEAKEREEAMSDQD